jgi:acetate kinase
MNVFVLNCGSSSLKYRMISMPSEEEILGGEVQRIGAKTAESSRIVHHDSRGEIVRRVSVKGYREAFSEVMKLLAGESGASPDIFAHRLVQGGTEFPSNSIIRDDDFEALELIKGLAPIHNPPVVEIIEECRRGYPGIPQAVVLDTAFHSTIPSYAYTYPIPSDIAGQLGIRKYGFHGISHQYVTRAASDYLHIPLQELNAVSCHLGSGGASICAVVGGKSVDNTMGFSPLQGLVMSTRCGDLDPALILKLIAYSGGDYSKVNDLLNKKSGVLGMSSISSDIRDVISRATKTDDERSQMTLDVYLWRIRKYLGAYLTVVGHADAIVFTDTIGESVPYVREAVCRNLEFFGVKLDEWKNKKVSQFPTDIAAKDSRVRIIVVKTNEELAIAKNSYELFVSQERDSSGSEEGESLDEQVDCINS